MLFRSSAYSELMFSQAYWPDFDAAQLHMALEEYAGRKRRFGKTQEQVVSCVTD